MGARPFPRAPVSGGGVPGGLGGGLGGEEPAVTGAVPCRAEEGQQEADLPQALQDPEEGESRRAAAPGCPCPGERGGVLIKAPG